MARQALQVAVKRVVGRCASGTLTLKQSSRRPLWAESGLLCSRLINPVHTMLPADAPLDRPRLYVDLNEMVESDLVLLSAEDSKADSSGASVYLQEGLVVDIYMDDVDDHGHADPLVARGTVEATAERGWARHVKWCCRISPPGIQRLSELRV